MVGVDLAYDEIVIMEKEQVKDGTGAFGLYTNSLALTNKDLILVKYGFLKNKPKNVSRYALSDIKKYNGQAQVKMKRDAGGLLALEIYFFDEVKVFVFQTARTKEIKKWVDAINKLANGIAVSTQTEQSTVEAVVETAAELLAEGVSSAINTFSSTFGIKLKSKQQVSMQCPNCSASLQGEKGTTIACPYCGGYITL